MAHNAGTVETYLVQQSAHNALQKLRDAGFVDECSYIEDWIRMLENTRTWKPHNGNA